MSRDAILPGSTIGILGGGQLGRMFVFEARRMGYHTIVLDPAEDPPAAQVADDHIRAPLDDADAARALARRCDVVTLEWENVDVAIVAMLTDIVPVRPGAHVLAIAQHRVREKDTARRLGLTVPDYRAIESARDLEAAVKAIGFPAVLKTSRGGYDGKGQRVLRKAGEVEAAFRELADEEPDLILESWLDFRMEASVVCARGADGEVASFPVVENIHRSGILDFTLAPARLEERVADEVRRVGEALAVGLDVTGLLAVEVFIGLDDTVYVNEIAPRPHNSGHYTLEGCSVSQFEQQLRAVCHLPLARPELVRPAAMANLLGRDIGTGESLPGTVDALAESVALHLYGKAEARPDRKMGHLTALADRADEAYERVKRARGLLAG